MTDDFDTLLRLHPRGDDEFENEPGERGWLYGGWTMALALRAAAATVAPGLQPRSLHAVFPAMGDAGTPLRLQVQRWRDGRTAAVRQVVVRQGDALPLLLTVSFHSGGDGADWQEEPAEVVPSAEGITSDVSLIMGVEPIEFRPVGPARADDGGPTLRPLHPYWARPRVPLAGDPILHSCVVTYVSDYMMVAVGQVPGAPPPPGSLVASLDHTVWFQRPFDADEWLLYSAAPSSVSTGRGFSRGTVRTTDGTLVASFAQESLTRIPRR